MDSTGSHYESKSVRSSEPKIFERLIEKAEAIAKRNEDIRSRVGRISDNLNPSNSAEVRDRSIKNAPHPGYGGIVGKLYELLDMVETSQDLTNESLSNIEKAI